MVFLKIIYNPGIVLSYFACVNAHVSEYRDPFYLYEYLNYYYDLPLTCQNE